MSYFPSSELNHFQAIRETVRLSFPSKLALVPRVVFYLTEIASRLGLFDPTESNFPVAIDEALTNAVIHGNGGEEQKLVHVKALFTPEKMKIVIRDEGPGFNFHDLPNPSADPGSMRTNGRGIFLIRALVKEVRFNKAGNQITLLHPRETSSKRPPATSHHSS